MATVDSYSISAGYYDDEYATKGDLNDLPFYLRMAAERGGPILELACGTGRILLPIARQGQEITGVDAARPMLDQLERKLAEEPEEVRARVQIREGDMGELDLGRRFRLITFPFRPLQHMYTVDEQLAALATARRHLADDGEIVLDVFLANHELLLAGVGLERPELEWEPATEPGVVVRRSFLKEEVHPVEQWFAGTFIFRAYRDGEILREEREPLRMSWYTWPQLQLLARHSGLEIVESYGDFEGGALTDESREMVLVLRTARD